MELMAVFQRQKIGVMPRDKCGMSSELPLRLFDKKNIQREIYMRQKQGMTWFPTIN